MGRTGTIDYRKLAFDSYAPMCVFCGFGIAAVLEVAHLDGDSANCKISNLAILCPTCHRMHDIELIPTSIVEELRDTKRKANWQRLLKDAGKKAAATKAATPGLLREAGRKAAATRKGRRVALEAAKQRSRK